MAHPGSKIERIDPRIVRTRRRILSAAVDIALSDGLGACSIKAVASQAGVARSTIYRNWDSKGEMLLDILEAVSAPADHIRPSGNMDTGTAIRLIVSRLVRTLGHAPWGDLITELSVASFANTDMEYAVRGFLERRLGDSAELVADAQRRGEISRSIDRDYVLGLIMGPIYYRYLMTGRDLSHEWVETHSARIVELLLGTGNGAAATGIACVPDEA